MKIIVAVYFTFFESIIVYKRTLRAGSLSVVLYTFRSSEQLRLIGV